MRCVNHEACSSTDEDGGGYEAEPPEEPEVPETEEPDEPEVPEVEESEAEEVTSEEKAPEAGKDKEVRELSLFDDES